MFFSQSASWLKELTKNAATSVVQITMNDATTKDMLSTATNMLDKVTEGQYLVVLSSQQPPLSAPANHGTSSRRRLLSNDNFWPGPSECSHSDEHYDVESGSCFRYVYMTPAILWGLFIGIFGAMVLYTGLGCLDGVQTPDVWMSKDDPGEFVCVISSIFDGILMDSCHQVRRRARSFDCQR